MTPARRALTAIAAATGLALLIIGLPILLITVIGWPLPHHIPTIEDSTRFLTSPLTDTILLNLIAILGWLAWANLVISLITETVRTLGHRQPDSTTKRGPIRILAASLLGAVTTSLPVAAQAIAPAAVTPAEPPETTPHTHTDPPITAKSTTVAATDRVTVEVVTGDTLWDIADAKLGDPMAWPDIHVINKGVTQPDGRALTDPDLIYPGWKLTIPSQDPAPDPAPDPTPEPDPEPSEPTAPPHTPEPEPVPSNPSITAPDTPTDHIATTMPRTIILGTGGTLLAFGAIAALIGAVQRARARASLYTDTTGIPSPTVELTGELADLEPLTNTDNLNDDAFDTNAVAFDTHGTGLTPTDIAGDGLALTGAGAFAFARAAIVTTLTAAGEDEPDAAWHVLTSRDTLDRLGITDDCDFDRIHRLTVTDTADNLIDNLQLEIIHRNDNDISTPPILVVVDPTDTEYPRMAAELFELNSHIAIAGLAIGDTDFDGPTAVIHPTGTGHHPTADIKRFSTATPQALQDALSTLASIDHTQPDPITGLATPATGCVIQPVVIPTTTPQPETQQAKGTASPAPTVTKTRAPAQQQLIDLLANTHDGATRDQLTRTLLPDTPLTEARTRLHELITATNTNLGSDKRIVYEQNRYRISHS